MSIYRISLLRNKLTNIVPQNHNRLFFCTAIKTIKNDKTEEFDEDQPIKFSQSKAAKWTAEKTRSGYIDPAPWFQPYVISASLTVFMAYFFYLREESDVDLEFSKSLYDRINGLEEKQLKMALEHSDNTLDTKAIHDRLNELEQNKT